MTELNKKQTLEEVKIISFLNEKTKLKQREFDILEFQEANIINLGNKKQLKPLFKLIIEKKIELEQSRRATGNYILALPLNKESKRCDELFCLLELFDFYAHLHPNKNWREFLNLTNNQFSHLPLVQQIKKLKLTIHESSALLKTIDGFIKGQHPVFINDISATASEMVELSILLHDENNRLVKENLLNVEVDRDGVSIRTSITRNTLLLIGQKCESRSQLNKSVSKNSLIQIIPAEKIQYTPLYYSDGMSGVFKDFCKLSHSIDKSENLSLLLHGAPGTGKTAFAHQLAKQINGVIYQLNFSQIQTKWVGETQRNVNQVFREYQDAWKKAKYPIILLINEADGLMNRRVGISTSNDTFANQVQTEFLEQLEKFSGILVATTNILTNIDSAFHRRFLFKTEVLAPDNSIRGKYLQSSSLNDLLSEELLIQLKSASWTIAEMKNIERKVNLLSRVRNLNTKDLEEILQVEGLLRNSNNQLGYQSLNN